MSAENTTFIKASDLPEDENTERVTTASSNAVCGFLQRRALCLMQEPAKRKGEERVYQLLCFCLLLFCFVYGPRFTGRFTKMCRGGRLQHRNNTNTQSNQSSHAGFCRFYKPEWKLCVISLRSRKSENKIK